MFLPGQGKITRVDLVERFRHVKLSSYHDLSRNASMDCVTHQRTANWIA